MPRDSYGFKIIWAGQVYPARTMGEAAEFLVRAYDQGSGRVRAKKCVSLTRDRDLTGREQAALVSAATGLLARRAAA